jgi:ABC-type Fe3+-hydroxamate transport system substrate-binding protein
VVAYGSQTELLTRLGRSQIPVFPYRHTGLADVTTTIRELGAEVGRTAPAGALADRIESDLADERRRVAQEPRPRTMLVFSREVGALRGIYASGGVGFLHDLLMTAGATDVFSDIRRESIQVSTEQLLARAPDVILEVWPSHGWSAARQVQEQAAWRQLPGLPAVRANRVVMLADDKLTIPGPRVAEVARAFADVLHPRR